MGKLFSEKVLSTDQRDEVCKMLLKSSYEKSNASLSVVQKSVDAKTGLNIQPKKAAYPSERVETVAHSLMDKTVDDSVIQRRAENAVSNVANSFSSDYVKENAQLRSDAGIKCYVERTTDGKCCAWCNSLAGKYEYSSAPDDVFRYHDKCSCILTYINGRTREIVWDSKKKTNPKKIKYKKPRVISKDEAKKLESENINYKGLKSEKSVDKSAESGIISIENCNKKIKDSKQNEHRQGHKRWIEESEKNVAKGNNPNSFIYEGVNEQELIDTLSGTGIVEYRKNASYPLEYVNTSTPKGETYERNIKGYIPTHRLCIVYSKKGTHIYPVTERSEYND